MRALRLAAAALVLVGSPALAGRFLVERGENIVVLGDSITADGRYAQIMQNLIDDRFPEIGMRVISAGASGDTVRRALTRLEADVVPWRPAWVLINLGVNDAGRFSLDEFLYNYEAMINRIQRDTGAKIGVMSPIWPDNDQPHDRYEEYMRELPKLAEKYGCLYIPCCEAFREIRPTLPKGVKYAPDGVHPVPLGYWIFAQITLKALGYPFKGKDIELTMPVTRLTAWDAPEAATLPRQMFTVRLPDPLKITIVQHEPNKAAVPRAGKPVVIDGKLDEWKLDSPLVLDKPEQQSGGVMRWGRDRHTAKAWLCYDDAGLYFAIAVDTPAVVHTPAATSVMMDCVELFVDLRTPEQKAEAKSHFYLQNKAAHVCQYILAPATPEVPNPEPWVGGGDKSMTDGFAYASTQTNTGYILECMIPAKQLPEGGLKPGATYGLDFTVNDVDRFESWADLIQMRWSGSAYSFFSVIEWGIMRLE